MLQRQWYIVEFVAAATATILYMRSAADQVAQDAAPMAKGTV